MGEILEVEGVLLTPLRIIAVPGGDVLRALKNDEPGYLGFGEAYFSKVQSGSVKGWKRHREMVLNLIVPIGAVKFVIFDDREKSSTQGKYFSVTLSKENYQRLTVPPMVWMAFQGASSDQSMLLNIASIQHDPEEVDNCAIHEIQFDWEVSK